MYRFIILDTQTPENIQDIIENIGYIPEAECITEFKDVVLKNKKIEKLSFDMQVDIPAVSTPAVVEHLVQKRPGMMIRMYPGVKVCRHIIE